MNLYQLLARERQTRRFSSGDGVVVAEGPHKGRHGVILAIGNVSHRDEAQRAYEVAFTDAAREGAVLTSAELLSDPKGNTGKYGGPARGGAAGRWCGGNNYRQRR